MNYEKKYKEALNRAKKIYKTAQDYLCKDSKISVECIKNALTDIFPELAESEDEKIRKWLIAQLKIKIGDNATLNNMIYKALAWLEKQGEKKPQRMISAEVKEALYDKPSWSEEDERICRDIINDIANDKHMCKFEMLKEICDEQINWLKSLKERMKGE